MVLNAQDESLKHIKRTSYTCKELQMIYQFSVNLIDNDYLISYHNGICNEAHCCKLLLVRSFNRCMVLVKRLELNVWWRNVPLKGRFSYFVFLKIASIICKRGNWNVILKGFNCVKHHVFGINLHEFTMTSANWNRSILKILVHLWKIGRNITQYFQRQAWIMIILSGREPKNENLVTLTDNCALISPFIVYIICKVR